ncbi:AAA family ATPase [Aeromonas salmonicida]|uniref:AAA family ATPase n=1 Tax=Aeromonas salmonicida TaxID=645 RepID=UPI002116809E|nr:AAA family ATPase [Aeromonas salmonicida]UUI59420.1 AAA family ATPase [Aeromonas salmonicida]
MNWQISRIEVFSFKAFKNIHLDLGESSLLTLDGPNGYGKTSIFDAIELLLTGKISRIQNLFETLLTGKKKTMQTISSGITAPAITTSALKLNSLMMIVNLF